MGALTQLTLISKETVHVVHVCRYELISGILHLPCLSSFNFQLYIKNDHTRIKRSFERINSGL